MFPKCRRALGQLCDISNTLLKISASTNIVSTFLSDDLLLMSDQNENAVEYIDHPLDVRLQPQCEIHFQTTVELKANNKCKTTRTTKLTCFGGVVVKALVW
ncbi:hypothetical protein M8J77_024187 [Diaphorina citri]|nr:hypothetical protein M8J77_024187 [Diaphorina citri]